MLARLELLACLQMQWFQQHPTLTPVMADVVIFNDEVYQQVITSMPTQPPLPSVEQQGRQQLQVFQQQQRMHARYITDAYTHSTTLGGAARPAAVAGVPTAAP